MVNTPRRPALPWLMVLCLSVTGVAHGHIRLPRLIGDGMVLQRDEIIRVWGWANPAERVSVTFLGQKRLARADSHGSWSVLVGPFPAGGPYEMTLQGRDRRIIHDILLGDVWLVSGQSNMEFAINDLKDRRQQAARANDPRIRLFMVKHCAALAPREDVSSQGWQPVTPASVLQFSAIGYLFGAQLQERYHVPIGLIQATWGGTTAETWMSAAALRAFPQFNTALGSLRAAESHRAEYERYVASMAAWYQKHAGEDLGQSATPAWSDPAVDPSHWPTIAQPRPDEAWGRDFNGFSALGWFRKDIDLPADWAGKSALLQLGRLEESDQTYFNGRLVGTTQGYDFLREYAVPGESVKAGRNVIVVRLVGATEAQEPALGMDGPEEAMKLSQGDATMSLVGAWYYQLGQGDKDLPLATPAILSARPSPTAPQYAPTVLFNGMIHPLRHFGLKGAIWYQGESNAEDHRSAEYRDLFPALIADWRAAWPDLPFLFVQLAGFGPNGPEPAESAWAELREAQGMALSLPHTAMASAVDVGDAADLHPQNKAAVAQRLALAAFRVGYGENVVSSGPTYRAMHIEAAAVRIEFDHVGSGLRVNDQYGYVRGFEIAGPDGKFRWARARQERDTVVVSNDDIQHPVAVRYDWTNTPDGNLFNREGLPATPFRTDAPRPARLLQRGGP